MQKIESNNNNNCSNKENNGYTKYIKRSGNQSNNVKFSANLKEKFSTREKKLTAKFSNHELMFIKNRLNLEMWIDERLHELYETSDESKSSRINDLYSDDLVDSLIKLDTDFERKLYLVEQLENSKKSQDNVNLFIDELLIRLAML